MSMRSWFLCAVGLLLGTVPAGVGAHPHHHVEQQAQLTIYAGSVDLVLRIVPSIGEGAQMFDAIDLDGDGDVSDAEADALGEQVLAAVELAVGADAPSLDRLAVSVPSRDLVARGQGVIEVRASAALSPSWSSVLELDFDVTYHRFSTRWFVQPFLARNLSQRSISVERLAGSGVKVRLMGGEASQRD